MIVSMRKTTVSGISIIVLALFTIALSNITQPVDTGFFFEELKNGELHHPFEDYFDLPAGAVKSSYRNLSIGTIHISLKTWSHGCPDIGFYVMDEAEYAKWGAGESASMEISYRRTHRLNLDWEVPYNANWYFVFDCSHDRFTHKYVYCRIILNWAEMLKKYSKRVYMRAPILLLGTALLVIGGAITVFGLISEMHKIDPVQDL